MTNQVHKIENIDNLCNEFFFLNCFMNAINSFKNIATIMVITKFYWEDKDNLIILIF